MEDGKRLFQNENYREALEKFQKESNHNNSCDIHLWIASCHIKLESYVDAKKEYIKVLNKPCTSAENNESIINLGNCYRFLDQMDSAMYFYNMAIEKYPHFASKAYFNKAQLLYKQSLFKEAKENYDKAILLDSLNSMYYMKRQEISFILKDFEAAIHDILRAKELNQDLDILSNLAYAYSMMGHFKQSDSIYQIIYDEKDAIFLNNYGFNKYKLGETQQGVELIQQSLSLDPMNSYAYRNLAVIAIDNNELEKACKYLTKAKNLKFGYNYGSEVDELILRYCP